MFATTILLIFAFSMMLKNRVVAHFFYFHVNKNNGV